MKRYFRFCVVMSAFVFVNVNLQAQQKAEPKKVQTQTNRELTDEQIKANEEFRKSLRDMDPEQRREAIRLHREEMLGLKQEAAEQRRIENTEKLKLRLEGNSNLSEDEKEELINHYHSRSEETMAFRHSQSEENMAFFESIANNSELTKEQRKAAIKAHFERQKQENMQFRLEQKIENEEFKQDKKEQKKESRREQKNKQKPRKR